MAKNFVEVEVRVRMKDLIAKRLANLLSIKSIVTLVLTAVFAYMAITNQINQESVKTIYTTIIAFYFGTQAEKLVSKPQVNDGQSN